MPPFTKPLSTQRKSIYPEADDTWETVAARELSELDPEQGIGNLQSWNLHVFMRPAAPDDSPRAGNPGMTGSSGCKTRFQ